MRFRSLSNKNINGDEILQTVLSILGDTENFFDDYKYQPHTPTRLQIALNKYYIDGNKDKLKRELYGRFLYDTNISGKKYVTDYPPLVHLELSSICNYRCTFCYQVDQEYFSKNRNFIDVNLFKTVIDQLEDNVPYITHSNRGEPTMHPHFAELVRYCKDKFLDYKINTNASLLNEEKILAMLDACHTVVFSIDSIENYSKLRVNGSLEHVVKNIKLFHDIRSTHPRKNEILTRASGVYLNDETQSQDKHAKFFKDIVDETSFVNYMPWENVYNLPKHNITKPCNEPFYRMHILYDGSVDACDMDYRLLLNKDGQRISNDYTVKDAWKSLSNIRYIHEEGKRLELSPCDQCPLPEHF